MADRKTLEEQYIRGYQKHPETEEELGWVAMTCPEVWEENPWEEEDMG